MSVLRFAALLLVGCGSAAPAAATVKWPPIIDSHVHLSYWPVAAELAASGVEGVVDLGSPERALGAPAAGLRVVAAGPMLTHPGGYPLDAWGADGFGAGCADEACVAATIDRLAAHGAAVIKLALDDDGLDPALVPAAVAAAHAHHLRVAVHALSDASVAAAGRAGVDILAHTPVEPLAPSTVALWKGRAVISTLAAFGGPRSAVVNLRVLRAAGAIVLYGTDLGNARVAGPNLDEISLLRAAGLPEAAIVDAMTTAPAAFWNIRFDPAASYLELDVDPRTDANTLLRPRRVWLDGRALR